jgi:CubicO group peptidase (beta-lactamase class C family)
MSACVCEGTVAEGFGLVAETFERVHAESDELGASFAAYRDGRLLVDIWGGVADSQRGARWKSGTLQVVFSGTKGLVAICLLMLVERGVLDLDAEVAQYWPEFGAAGKGDIQVRDVVSHQARLPGLVEPVTWQEATDARRMATLVAAQPQSDDPRAARTYHALTYGWICGELIRRIDGRSIGRFFADDVADRLGLEIWIGLPAELEPRVAPVKLAADWGTSPAFRRGRFEADPLWRSVFANPVRYSQESFPWNEPLWRAAEIPGANAIGTARSIAKLYASLGELLAPETLERARQPLTTGRDTVLGTPMAFGIGFQLQTEEMSLGPPPDAFGHGGSGGSQHGCWPTQGIGFSYSMNLLRDDDADRRAKDLLDALYISLQAGA